MKLITETTEDVRSITEEVNGKKNLYVEGVFLQANIKNRNGRIYPVHVLEKEVDRYVTEEVQRNKAYGELNHPASPQMDLDRACIRIVELKQDGNNFNGKALVLNTPKGDIVRGLLEGECNIGVSSRGMGTLKKNGMITEVQADFRLATAADVVSNPSAPDAFVNGIMENVDWVFSEKNGWQALHVVETTKEMIKKNLLSEEARMRSWRRFVDAVTNVEFFNESRASEMGEPFAIGDKVVHKNTMRVGEITHRLKRPNESARYRVKFSDGVTDHFAHALKAHH